MMRAEEARRLLEEVRRRKQAARMDSTLAQPRQDWESSLGRRPREARAGLVKVSRSSAGPPIER